MTHPVPRPFRRSHKNQARVWERRVRGSRDGPRLRGVCAACGEECASPDTRRRCPGCREGDLCYGPRGREPLEGLIALCEGCHGEAHREGT